MSAQEARTFTYEQREVLVGDGAVLYFPETENIRSQRTRRAFWFVTSGYGQDGMNRLLDFPPRAIEVAIYPDPERFFVPGTFNKTTNQQNRLSEQDAEELRKRLSLEGIGIIKPEASEVTGIMFKHFDETGIRLLGEDYINKQNGYWPYIRTSTPTTRTGSHLARVGYFRADHGPSIDGWFRGTRNVSLGLARWIVPTSV